MMLGKNLLIALLVAFSCAIGGLKGQVVFQLSYDSLNFPTPSTQSYGGFVQYTFTIQNVSATTFSDSLYIRVRTDSITSFVLVAYDTLTIPPLDTFQVNASDSVIATRYGGGVNVLVIWPTSPSFIETDSITDTLIVLGTSVDEGRGNGLALDVFPVPSQGQVFLRARNHVLPIRQTCIVSVTGQILKREEGLPSCVDMNPLPRGIYFIHVEDEEGTVARIKIIKQ
jgi:hypothetical protein